MISNYRDGTVSLKTFVDVGLVHKQMHSVKPYTIGIKYISPRDNTGRLLLNTHPEI